MTNEETLAAAQVMIDSTKPGAVVRCCSRSGSWQEEDHPEKINWNWSLCSYEIVTKPPPPKECFCIISNKTGVVLSVFGNQQSATDWVRYLSGEVRVVRYVPVEENKEKEGA